MPVSSAVYRVRNANELKPEYFPLIGSVDKVRVRLGSGTGRQLRQQGPGSAASHCDSR